MAVDSSREDEAFCMVNGEIWWAETEADERTSVFVVVCCGGVVVAVQEGCRLSKTAMETYASDTM